MIDNNRYQDGGGEGLGKEGIIEVDFTSISLFSSLHYIVLYQKFKTTGKLPGLGLRPYST